MTVTFSHLNLLSKSVSISQYLLSVLCFFMLLKLSKQSEIISECNVSSTLTRKIGNDGFHRELIYNAEVTTSRYWHNCKLIVEEIIPSGLYVNTDQLAELFIFGKVSAFANVTVDIESPEFESLPHSVFIYSDLKYSAPGKLISSFYIPVHLRYHKPQSGGGYHQAALNNPIIYIHCNEAPICPYAKTRVLPCSNLRKTLCLFQIVQHISLESLDHDFLIPVGNADHALLVGVVTFLVTLFGSIFILSALTSCEMKNKTS